MGFQDKIPQYPYNKCQAIAAEIPFQAQEEFMKLSRP